MSDSLISPLWGIVVGYVHRAEQTTIASLPWFAAHVRPWDDAVDGPYAAALGDLGDVAVLERYEATASSRNPDRWDDTRTAAITRGNLPALQWLVTRGCQMNYCPSNPFSNSLTIAAIHNRVELFAFLHNHGCKNDETSEVAAAKHGFDTFIASLPHRITITKGINALIPVYCSLSYKDRPRFKKEFMFRYSAEIFEHLDALALVQTEAALDELDQYWVAPQGHIADQMMEAFVALGNLEMLRIAHTRGFTTPVVCYMAFLTQRWDIYMWARDTGIERSWWVGARIEECKDPALVAWLKARGGKT